MQKWPTSYSKKAKKDYSFKQRIWKQSYKWNDFKNKIRKSIRDKCLCFKNNGNAKEVKNHILNHSDIAHGREIFFKRSAKH